MHACSPGVERALLGVMRMDSLAGTAQQAVVLRMADAMQGLFCALPLQEGATLPTAAQVPCPLSGHLIEQSELCTR